MQRVENFLSFTQRYDGVSFNGENVTKIYDNLEKAVNDNRLGDFILNKAPYKSAFKFVTSGAIRSRDQVAIVIALNFYGADHPEFVYQLSAELKNLARGKGEDSVTVLMAAQMEFQKLEVSLVNFVDRELIELVNKSTKEAKRKNILLWCFMLCLSGIGVPGFTMIGLPLLSLPFVVLMLYSLFFKLIYWIFMPVFKESVIDEFVRDVGNCVSPNSIKLGNSVEKCEYCDADISKNESVCPYCKMEHRKQGK